MIQKLIDEALLKEQESRKDRVRSGLWSPSSLGRCFRAQYWNRKNEPVTNPIESRVLRVFKCGKLFHNFVQEFLPEHQVEVKIQSEDILGYADIVTEDTVFDIKSMHSRGFWYMDKEGYDVKKEKYPNWLQLACYGVLLKKPKLCLVMVSKDDLCIAEYVQFTKDWEEDLNKELSTLRKHWVEGLPKPEPRCYNGKECTYCGFQTKCKGK